MQTKQRTIPASELILNDDGSVFHLHLRPGEVANTVILVGDPGRVRQVAAYFDECEVERSNREFTSITGRYMGRRMTVCSTGIGTDNIDIVITELDALVNIDFATRQVRDTLTRLTLLRLGTCGALQSDLRIGDHIFSRVSAGLDNLPDYYADSAGVCNRELGRALSDYVGRQVYCVDASEELAALFGDTTIGGITVSAPGFYGPQGRELRLRPAFAGLNDKLASFVHGGLRVANMEMESSAVAALGRMLGHRPATVCTVVAQRTAGEADPDYRPFVEKMIKMSLDKLSTLR